MGVNPKHIVNGYLVYSAAYTASMFHPSSCDWFFGSKCSDADRFLINGGALMWLFVSIQLAALSHWAGESSEGMGFTRQICKFMSYMFALSMGFMIATGQKDFGGVFVRDQFIPGIVGQVVFMFLLGSAQRSGSGALSKVQREPFQIKSVEGVHFPLMYSLFMMMFWFFDVTCFSGAGKYITAGIKSDTEKAMVNFNMVAIGCQMFTFMLVTSYAKDTMAKKFLKMMAGMMVVFELFTRFVQDPTQMDAEQLKMGSAMRLVNVLVIMYGIRSKKGKK